MGILILSFSLGIRFAHALPIGIYDCVDSFSIVNFEPRTIEWSAGGGIGAVEGCHAGYQADIDEAILWYHGVFTVQDLSPPGQPPRTLTGSIAASSAPADTVRLGVLATIIPPPTVPVTISTTINATLNYVYGYLRSKVKRRIKSEGMPNYNIRKTPIGGIRGSIGLGVPSAPRIAKASITGLTFQEASPAYLYTLTDFSPYVDDNELLLPFYIENAGDGDWLDIVMGSETVWSVDLSTMDIDTLYNAVIPGELVPDGNVIPTLFRLHSVGESNASVTFVEGIDDPMFTAPIADAVLSNPNGIEEFEWISSLAVDHWLYVGSSLGARDYHDSGLLSKLTRSRNVSGLPVDGSLVYARLWFRLPDDPSWLFTDVSHTAIDVGAPEIIIPMSPGPFTDVSGAEAIEWLDVGESTVYWIYAGSEKGGRQYYNSGNLGQTTTSILSGLPTNRTDVWVRLWYRVGDVGNWRYIDEMYTAANVDPSLDSSSTDGTLTAPSDTFSWVDPIGLVAEWWLYVGSSVGGREYEDSGSLGSETSYTTLHGNIPAGGLPIHVRLWFRPVEGNWKYIDRNFVSAP